MDDHELKLFRHIHKAVFEGESLVLDIVEAHSKCIYDVLWLVGLEFDTMISEQTARYQRIIETLLKRGVLTKDLLLIHLDDQPLYFCSLISSVDHFKKRQNIIRTKFIYEQQKFNLIREESEGFLTFFSVLHSNDFSNALELIGTYDLDPNRAADIIITVYSQNSAEIKFLELLKQLNLKTLVHIFGIKFQNSNDVCKPLCEVAAACIKAGLFDLQSIWSYLKPESLQTVYDEHQKLIKAVKRSMDVYIIGADNSKNKDLLRLERADNNNQKLGLLTELIRLNHFTNEYEILQNFKGKLVLSSCQGTIDVLCDLLQWMIDPVYSELPKPLPVPAKAIKFPTGDLNQLTSMSEIQTFLHHFLQVLDFYIGFSDDTYNKVLKVFQHCEDKAFVLMMIEKYILPALSFAGVNVIRSLWTSIQDFHYLKRYNLYSSWKNCKESLLAVRQSITIRETRAWIKRLSRENIDKGREDMCKFMHKNTCAVLQEMIIQIVSYPNLIPVCVESFNNAYYLYHDIVPYSILQYLCTCTKPKIDYNGISLWIQNISNFTGEFFKTYYKTELTGILSYISECLSTGQIVEIYILKQILSKMSGWNPPENLTEKMLSSLAGGPKLKIAAYKLGDVRSRTTKSSQALCSALQQVWSGGKLNFAMELAILAAQQAGLVLYSESSNFKMQAVLYDNLISSIILLIDILSLQFNEAKSYSELLPHNPIVVLTNTYHLPLPLVMYIVRPGIDISKFEGIIEQLKVIAPDSRIPLQFLAIFWALSLSDIRSAETQYNAEVESLKISLQAGSKNQAMIDSLQHELSFLNFRQGFFADFIKKHTVIPKDCQIAKELVQKGIYPRLLCSPSDALYCAYFIETIMKLQITDFTVFDLIYQCITLILPCVNCCTEGEASNIGFFFLELLKILSGWKFGIENDGKHCPVLKEVSIKMFRENFTNYHLIISGILCEGLKGSYLVQKNCLSIINRVFAEFPNNKETAKELMKHVGALKDSRMEDIKLIAQRVFDNLEKKFCEVVVEVAPVVLPKKRSHDKDENGKGRERRYEHRSRGSEVKDRYNGEKKSYRV